jgi:hypothetical protein
VPLPVMMLLVLLLGGATYAAHHYRQKCAAVRSATAAHWWEGSRSNAESEAMMMAALTHAAKVMSDQREALIVTARDHETEDNRSAATALDNDRNDTAKKPIWLTRQMLEDASSALSLGIFTAGSSSELIQMLQKERDQLNSKGEKLAAEATLMLAKVEQLESDLSLERLRHASTEKALLKTENNLTRTHALWKAISTDITEERHGRAGEDVEVSNRWYGGKKGGI